MAALALTFLRKHWAAFVLVASICAIGAFIYMKGWSDRGEKERAASQTHTINRTDNRGKINEKVRKLDDAGVCGALGGLYRDDECQ